MDMKISGNGVIASGEYDNIRIAGSGELNGLIRCTSFHCAGSSHADGDIECENELKIAGSGSFDKSVKAGELKIAGSMACNGDISVGGKLNCAGTLSCDGSVKVGYFNLPGAATIKGDTEAEIIKVDGKIDCDGLINAEEIEIRFVNGMNISSIGGSKISIYEYGKPKNRRIWLPLFSSLVKHEKVFVKNSIEGDVIALEGVVTPRVSGRIVAIGEGCNIDIVQYSEKIEISPNAKVGKTEKV